MKKEREKGGVKKWGKTREKGGGTKADEVKG